jgi:uncharacterized OB-fold protein
MQRPAAAAPPEPGRGEHVATGVDTVSATGPAPVAEGIFTWPSTDPRLVGGRCRDCGIVTFPNQDSCPRCASTGMQTHLLPPRGRLWAWTTQSFPPPSPPYAGAAGDAFVPFGIGYVDLGEVKVESRLTTADPAVLRHGMEMELTIVPFGDDAAEVVTFAFRPVDAEGGHHG